MANWHNVNSTVNSLGIDLEMSRLRYPCFLIFTFPYSRYLLPDKSKKTKRKTPTIKKNVNPLWNHTIVYENLSAEELLDRVLELTVWDWDRGLSNSFLGGVRLGMLNISW